MWDVLCPRRKQAVLVLNGQLIPFCSACVPVIRSCGKWVSLAGKARTLGVFDSSGKLQRQKVLPELRGAWAKPHMASCWVALGRPLGFGHVPSHVCCVPSEHGIVFIHSGLVPARIQALPLCCLLQGQPHNALEQNQPPSQKYPQHPKITLPPTLNEIFSYC